MSFADIIGHDQLIGRMQGALERDRLAHAYIFEGPSGIGKASVAKELAEAILCETSKSNACGRCDACMKFVHENHPDYLYIEPDGASIKNKQIEGFQEFVLTKPYDRDAKIVIIDRAESMTVSAQNRILKVLEEPPAYATIIFVTENGNGLLPTIRSRCQTVRMNRLSSSLIEQDLVDKKGLAPDLAKQCAAFADGSYGMAVHAAESEDFQSLREAVENMAAGICSRKFMKALDQAQFFEDHKEDIDQLLNLLIGWFRDIVFIKGGYDHDLIRNRDRLSALQTQASQLEYKEAVQAIERIEKAKRQVRAYVNLGLILETLILDIQEGMK